MPEPIRIQCPHCDTPLRAKAVAAGQVTRCPKCRERFEIPPDSAWVPRTVGPPRGTRKPAIAAAVACVAVATMGIGLYVMLAPKSPVAPTAVAEQDPTPRKLHVDEPVVELTKSEPVPAALLKPDTFRKTRWRMSREQVISAEGRQPDQEQDGTLLYNGKVAGYPCFIGYILVKDLLVRGAYAVNTKHINANDDIAEYGVLKVLLSAKYGDPQEDKKEWKTKGMKQFGWDDGTALQLGHLVFSAKWCPPETDVLLTLTCDDGTVLLRVDYISRDFGHLETMKKFVEGLRDL